MLNCGAVKIGTLYEFRRWDTEALDRIRGDAPKGTQSIVTLVDKAVWSNEDIPRHLRGMINVPEPATLTDLLIDQPWIDSNDCYAYCMSDRFDYDAMIALGYDACVRIRTPLAFMRSLTEAIAQRTTHDPEQSTLGCQSIGEAYGHSSTN